MSKVGKRLAKFAKYAHMLTFRLDYAGKAKMSELFDNTAIINNQSTKCT